MTLVMLLPFCLAALALLGLLWRRVSARDLETSKHNRIMTHLDWLSSGRPRRGKAARALRRS